MARAHSEGDAIDLQNENIADPVVERSFRGHKDAVKTVAFNPNMKQLVRPSARKNLLFILQSLRFSMFHLAIPYFFLSVFPLLNRSSGFLSYYLLSISEPYLSSCASILSRSLAYYRTHICLFCAFLTVLWRKRWSGDGLELSPSIARFSIRQRKDFSSFSVWS